MSDFFRALSENASSVNTTPKYIEYTSSDIASIDIREVMRYTGIPKSKSEHDERLSSILDLVSNEALKGICYKVSYSTFLLDHTDDGYPILPFAQHSDNLRDNLQGCDGVILFCATIGPMIDRLIFKYDKCEPSKSLLLQGLGAERVEALCDRFCLDIKNGCAEYGCTAKPRYSPGYGDLDIKVQPEMIMLTDATRKCGVTLSSSLLMSPSKSVTAIVGISKNK